MKHMRRNRIEEQAVKQQAQEKDLLGRSVTSTLHKQPTTATVENFRKLR